MSRCANRSANARSCVTITTVMPSEVLRSRIRVQNVLAGAAVEVAGGLIGQQQRRPVCQRTSNRDALLLAA